MKQLNNSVALSQNCADAATTPRSNTDTATTPRSNTAQEEAIRHKDGPMLVLAGPGSGKTYVITNRVKHLIEEEAHIQR